MNANRGRYGEVAFALDTSDERARLDALAAASDQHTTATLAQLGITAAMSALDVGAGTIASWLADHIPAGTVMALDRDTTYLTDPRVTARELDLADRNASDADLVGSFDLIHARFVLMHLPAREVLQRLTTWLAPGGPLVVTDAASYGLDSTVSQPMRRVLAGMVTATTRRVGTDFEWARNYPAVLQEQGLVEPTIGIVVQPIRGAWGGFLYQSVHTLREMIQAETGIGDAEFDAGLAELADPHSEDYAFAVATATARRRGRG